MPHTSLESTTAAPTYREDDLLPHVSGEITWLDLPASEIAFCQIQPGDWGKSVSFRVDESRTPYWSVNGSSECTVSGYGVADDGTGIFNPPASTFVDDCLDPNLPAGSLCAAFWQFADLPLDQSNGQITQRHWKHLFAKPIYLGADSCITIPRGARYLALSINCEYGQYASNTGSAYITVSIA